MSKVRSETAGDSRQTLDQLQQRYARLHERKVRADANLETAQKQLDRLRQEAREKYGTDDLDQLRSKLTEMEQSNERQRSEYQLALEAIEGELAQVEAKFQSASGDQ